MAVPPPAPATPPAPPRDAVRETVETLVFVVVLVLVLKLFVVEAFVIPTGSMAETLLGWNKQVECAECGFRFPVNATDEAEPTDPRNKAEIVGYTCPNCRHTHGLDSGKPTPDSGDRVLVEKFVTPRPEGDRGHVVVFKYPEKPQTGQVAQNYIKRLVGFGGETLAIHGGDLYLTPPNALAYDPAERTERGEPRYPRPANDQDAWRSGYDPTTRTSYPDFTYACAPQALDFFEECRRGRFEAENGFHIYRKPDDILLAERRIVYDNTHQSVSLVKAGKGVRWTAAGGGWTADDANGPKTFTHAGDDLGWVRYRHLLPRDLSDETSPGWTRADAEFVPQLITNFMGYNAGKESGRSTHLSRGYWVGDLIVECRVKLDDAAAEVVLELSKGQNRYQAVFAAGQVSLVRTGPDGKELSRRPTPLTKPGSYVLRFANVDCRLRVWVDDKPVDFGTEGDYPPGQLPDKYDDADTLKEGWTEKNDKAEPVSVGGKGGVGVTDLKVWRDTYYTLEGNGNSANRPFPQDHVHTYFVQPGHYMCMGDNSAASSDSRYWGLVPERLMLGRAVFVFAPFPPWGRVNRVGFIK